MRHQIVQSLVSEVLGPREGPYEILPHDHDPRDEYITGVLAPVSIPRLADDIESDVDETIEETQSPDPQEDQETQFNPIVPGVFSPALDPKALPRSIGLSFAASTREGRPKIEICATWARYNMAQNGWQRSPESFLTGPVYSDREQQWNAALGVLLQLNARYQPNGDCRISVFLINMTEVKDTARPATNDFLFQPQIRITCVGGTELAAVRQIEESQDSDGIPGSLANEENSLGLVYRDRTVFARGHLCGAIWKDIDPETPFPEIETPNSAPFSWTDAITVDEIERHKFSPADVRTELVPCYPIETPEMDWDENYGPTPILDPEELAETWNNEHIRQALHPLLDGYLAWISSQQAIISTLPETQVGIANLHLDRCLQAAERIGQAVDILENNEDVRLAFCFANKAIAIQSRWTRGQVFTWRPFQLAFILLNIPALADPTSADRGICDLLWFPTGGGKTEAYLGVTAFTLALRRRQAFSSGNISNGLGTGVLSRYTLRLLTIQQFRRAVGLITACEFLRVDNLDISSGPVGWRPVEYTNKQSFLWGGSRFSVGLWVGGGVTPNNMLSIGPIPGQNGMTFYAGALDILQGAKLDRRYQGPNSRLRENLRSSHLQIDGEPAQVLSCPCCKSILALSDEGLSPGQHTLFFAFQCGQLFQPSLQQLCSERLQIQIDSFNIYAHPSDGYYTLSVTFTVNENTLLSANQVDEWWYQTITPVIGSQVNLLPARPTRPGYVILTYDNSQNNSRQNDFDIFCPNPDCELNQHAWAEQVPLARSEQSVPLRGNGFATTGQIATEETAALPMSSGFQWQNVTPGFRLGRSNRISKRIPIPAFTVDDQIYHRCPSLVIATVDKFARLAYEPKAASLFGHVNHYHSRWGYYREGSPPSSGGLPSTFRPHPPGRSSRQPLHVVVSRFLPPDLILQDELHLIEGPLGSMVGLYETAIEALCCREINNSTIRPKYIASTATVRQAENQVLALFNRELSQFPSWCLSADDRFFARARQIHALDSNYPGRLYVAICAPGKGAQTPIVRIWSQLLQSVQSLWDVSHDMSLDRFWTLVGYFNAVRELAGALSLFRQDIPERIDFRAGATARQLDRSLELSGRNTNSLDLPGILDRIGDSVPNAQDVVFATSMFGTGVDVNRLGLMVVHGQPKTTASYIQATGRVGRQNGGLVVTFFRASRPRDLDHYEFFTGYHHALYRYVEPITVAPFSPRGRERGLGPLAVILLRQAEELAGFPVNDQWQIQQRLGGAFYSQAQRMCNCRHDPEVDAIPQLIEDRASSQPAGRRPPNGITATETSSEIDRWAALASLYRDANIFVYHEATGTNPPQRNVVLGDAQHRARGFGVVYENAPQSLREVEESTGFQI